MELYGFACLSVPYSLNDILLKGTFLNVFPAAMELLCSQVCQEIIGFLTRKCLCSVPECCLALLNSTNGESACQLCQ